MTNQSRSPNISYVQVKRKPSGGLTTIADYLLKQLCTVALQVD